MLTDNPIFYREWLSLRRRRRGTWLARLTYPAVLGGPTLLLAMLSAFTPHRYGMNLRDAAEAGFAVSVFLHCLFVALRAISSTVATVAWEKERRTFDILTATPMSPRALLGGKFLSTQVPLLLEMACYLPGWLVFWFIGAARLGQVAELAFLTVGLQAFFSSFGLWASLARGSAESAGRLVYGVLGALTMGDSLLYLVVESGRGCEDGPKWTQAINPFFAAGSIVWGDYDSVPLWFWCGAIGMALAPVFLWAALRRFSRPEAAVRRTLRVVEGVGPEQPLAYRSWLSFRRGGFPWLAWVVYPALVLGPCIGTGAILMQSKSGFVESSVFVGLLGHILFFVLLALGRASSCVARERERGAWDELLGTLLTGSELYRAQLMSVARPLLRQLVLSSPALFLLTLPGPISPLGILGVIAFTAVSILFWSALGLFLSYRCSSSLRALQIGVGVLAGLVIAPLVLDLTISGVFGGDTLIFCYVDPLLAVLSFSSNFFGSSTGVHDFLGPISTILYLLVFGWLARRGESDFTRASGV